MDRDSPPAPDLAAPLRRTTAARRVTRVMRDPLALLIDHAHLELAAALPGSPDALARRGSAWLDEEAAVLDAQPPGPGMHGGVAS